MYSDFKLMTFHTKEIKFILNQKLIITISRLKPVSQIKANLIIIDYLRNTEDESSCYLCLFP
jgi:hypothetical protein